MPAGRAQPPRGHPSLGHPAATSPTDTGAMTATSRQAKSSSWSRVQDEGRGQAAGRAGRLWQDPLLPAGWVGLPSPLSGSLPPRCSAKACGRSSPSASGTRRAAQGRALSWENGALAWRERNTKKVHFWQLTQRGGTLPAAGMGMMDAATGDAAPWLYPSSGPPRRGGWGRGRPCQRCPHSALTRGDLAVVRHLPVAAEGPASMTRPLSN